MEHMVHTFEPRLLERNHFQRILHNEDRGLIARSTLTNCTTFPERYHLADFAVPNIALQFYQRIAKTLWGSFGTAQKMERQTLCRFWPNAREFGELLNGFLDLGREEGHDKRIQKKNVQEY